MVNESKIVIFQRQVWWYTGKERVLGGEGKTKFERKRRRRDYHQYENSPKMPVFIARLLTTYYLLYFSLFIIL